MAVASLVLGIVAVILSFLVIGFFAGIVGVALGWVFLARNKTAKSAMAIWGVCLSLVGMLASAGFCALYYSFVHQFTQTLQTGGSDYAAWEGVPAPDITLTNLDGKSIRLSDLKGQRVVLDFWATWCPPCREEIPHFVQLYKENGPGQLAIIGISDESADVLRPFVAKNGMNYPVASCSNLPPPFKGIPSIPTTFFIDRHGIIQKIDVGYHDYSTLKADALGPDWSGPARSQPAAPSALIDSPHPLRPIAQWSNTISGAEAVSAGAWETDGATRILVAAGATLHVLDLNGVEKSTVPLPDQFTLIECGQGLNHEARLLGYGNWGHEVFVMDRTGKKLWGIDSTFGVDGAHFGDLDGSGADGVVAGMNGFGGLKAHGGDGHELWTVRMPNVWNQAIVPAVKGRPAEVFATEAGGSVHIIDNEGKSLRIVRPEGGYFAHMTAHDMGGTNGIQIMAINGDETLVFDDTGRILWKTSAVKNPGDWRAVSFAAGDLMGNGSAQWVFFDGSSAVIIASAAGEKLASIPVQGSVQQIAIAPQPGGAGLLLTLNHGALTAYSFAP
jgi:thiol-disulfide isomerase/thioredoxin